MLSPAILICGALVSTMAVGSLISCEVFTNYSFVDRSWSIVPVVYAWIVTLLPESGTFTVRPFIMSTLALIWGTRLTYNFARKGGYDLSSEDYRWPIIREQWKIPRIVWFLFNLFFTSIFQCVLLALLVVPVYAATTSPLVNLPWSPYDTLCAVTFLLLLTFEAIADNQQFAFQTEKYARLAALKSQGASVADLPEPYSHGFLSSGLFALSRHPNFFAEMAQWWTMAAFAAPRVPLYLWLPGPLLLTLLFVGSTDLTEKISTSKYPLYRVYQRRTSAIIPWLPGTPLSLSDLKKEQ